MSQATRQNSGRGAGGRSGAQGRPGPGPGRRTWLTFLLILLANFLVIRLLFPHPAAGKVPYTLFKQEVAKRNVEQIYSRGESLTGRFHSPVTYPSSRDTTARAAQRSIRDFETTLPAFVDPGLEALLQQWQPQQIAIETVFMDKSAMSALKLGHARGAALATVVRRRLPVSEYEPRVIKQSLVGRGAADKLQVQHMVRLLLKLPDVKLQADAADALAVALTHAHMSATAMRSGLTTDQLRRRRG